MTPDRPSVTLLIRLPPELLAQVRAQAAAARPVVSVSAYVREALRAALEVRDGMARAIPEGLRQTIAARLMREAQDAPDRAG